MTLATSTANAINSLIVILLLASVHLSAKQLLRLETRSRYALLSAAAGASLAYVLVRILPKLAEKQVSLMASIDTGVRGFLEHHAYLVAMAGLVIYYGLSRVAAYGAEEAHDHAPLSHQAALVATIAGHGAYSMLIGYVIVNGAVFGLFSLTLITVGLGTVFLLSDHSLRKKWPKSYDRWIRWVLSLSLLAGWAVGVWTAVAPNVVALWYAFLAGIMLITTIGEKLSMPESGSYWHFVAGALALTAALLVLEQMPNTII